MAPRTSSTEKLRAFFLGLTGRSFAQLGLGDRQIVEYVATMLTEFAQSDRWLWLRNLDHHDLSRSVDEILVGLETEGETRILSERLLRKYIGDYALFMSGLFRAYTEREGCLPHFLAEGKRSYQKVSELDLSLYRPGFMLFDQLSREFEYYSGALDYMRKCFLPPSSGQSSFAGFLKELEGIVGKGRTNN